MLRTFNRLIPLKAVALVQIESLVILFSYLAAARIWFWNDPAGRAAHAPLPFFLVQCLTQVVLLQLCFYYNGLYTIRHQRSRIQQMVGLMRAIGMVGLISVALYFLAPLLTIGRGVTILALTFTLAGVCSARLLLEGLWRAAVPPRNVLVIGTGSLAAALVYEVRRCDDLKLTISAFMAADPVSGGEDFFNYPVLSVSSLIESVERLRISQIVVAVENASNLPMRDLVRLRLRGISVTPAHEILETLSGRVRLDAVLANDGIFEDGFQLSDLTLAWKRAFDLLFSMAGILLAAPVMGLTAVAIWLETGGPVLYRQTRVGLGGKEFELLKFRSMRVDAEANGEAQWAVVDDPRVTRVGAFLRAHRLDELPQFINIFRGEMSVVGPRPERRFFVSQLRDQIPYYDERHLVRPGLTGWSQVKYPYGRTIEQAARKLEYDLFYLKNLSIAFDCAIALKTLRIVFLGRASFPGYDWQEIPGNQ